MIRESAKCTCVDHWLPWLQSFSEGQLWFHLDSPCSNLREDFRNLGSPSTDRIGSRYLALESQGWCPETNLSVPF